MRSQRRVIVLNGISSAGKSTIARQLQSSLDGPYLVFGVDTLIAAMPEAPAVDGPDLIMFEPNGAVAVGLTVDTTHDSAASCAARIVTWLDRRGERPDPCFDLQIPVDES